MSNHLSASEIDMKSFDEVFEDRTKYGTKIKTDEYHISGAYPIIDQGQEQIAGYTDREEGLFQEIPALIFGDHTRVVKYVDEPFFLGADGVKVLRCRLPDANYRYLYYALRNAKVPDTGYNRHFKWLKVIPFSCPDPVTQERVVRILDKITEITEARNKELALLDELVKARFVEMFGTERRWQEFPLSAVCRQVKRYPTFCNMEYIEDGVRVIRIGNILEDGHMDENDDSYVFVYADANKDYPDTVIEKNDIVMAVRGDGSTAKRIGIITEEKLVGANISPNLIRIQANDEMVLPRFLFCFLTSEIGQQRLETYVNKTAKKNIAAKDIVKVMLPVPPMNVQEQYSAFVAQVDKSKSAIQKSLAKTQTLFDSLMQEYFG